MAGDEDILDVDTVLVTFLSPVESNMQCLASKLEALGLSPAPQNRNRKKWYPEHSFLTSGWYLLKIPGFLLLLLEF